MDAGDFVVLVKHDRLYRTAEADLVASIRFAAQLLCRGVHSSIQPATAAVLRDVHVMPFEVCAMLNAELTRPGSVTMVHCIRNRMGLS